MRRFINQYVFSPLFWLMSLLLITLFLMVILLFTPLGPKAIAYTAAGAVKDLTINGVSGSIFTGLRIDELEWDSKVGISAKNIDINVDRYDTEEKKLFADKFVVGELAIVLKEENTDDSAQSNEVVIPNFGLPINIDANQLQLNSLNIVDARGENKEQQNLLFQVEGIQLNQVSIQDGQLMFGSLAAKPQILEQPLAINIANGSLSMNQPHELSAGGNVSFIHPELGSLEGKIQLGGTLTDYILDTELEFNQDKVGEGSLVLGGEGDYKSFNVTASNIKSEHGNADIKGDVLWNPEIRLNFDIDGQDVKTEAFIPDWPVTADTKVIYNGSIIDSRLENNIDIVNLEGEFRGQKLLAKGQITDRQGLIRTEGFDVQLGNNKVTASGAVTEPLSLELTIDAQNLTQLMPELSGKVTGSAVVKGQYKTPQIESKLSANSLSYGDIKQGEETLFLNTDVGLEGEAFQIKSLVANLGSNEVKLVGKANEPFDLKWDIDTQNLSQISPLIKGKIKGGGVLKGTAKTLSSTLKIQVNNLLLNNFQQGKDSLFVEGEVSMDDAVIQLKSLSAKSGDNVIEVSGQASEPFDITWDINAKQLSQVTPAIVGKINGGGVLKGTASNLSSSLKLKADNFVLNDYKQGKDSLFLEGEVSLDEKVIQLKSLLAKSGTNSINVSGQASEPVDLNIKVNAQKLSEVSPDISGRVTGTTSIKGPYKSPIIKADLLGSGLALKQQRLTQSDVILKGEVGISDGVPIVKQLNTQIGNNTFQVSGRAISPYDLTWNIDSKNLNQLLPELFGSVVIKGKLQGTIDKPIINAEGDVKNLKFEAFGLRSGKFTASTKNGIYRIKSDLNQLKNAEQELKSANLELNGTIENHAITATVDHSEAKLDLKANGGWQNQQWNGSVRTLNLADTQAGDWKLQKPARVSISQAGFSADQLCFSSNKTRACSVASYSKSKGLTAKGTLEKTPLSLLKPFLPENLELNGDVEGSYDIKQNNGKPTGLIKFALPKSSFSFEGEDGEPQSLSYENAEITANINDRTINAEAKMSIINRGVFSSKAKIQLSPQDGRHTVDGAANFDIPNINFAQNLIPRSRGLRGAMSSKLTFTGLLSKPQIKGSADVKNAYLRLPEAGTEITNINIKLLADKPGQATINGKMLMGDGVLNVVGDMDLKDIAKWKANIKISGKNIRFMNTNEIRAIMSPEINLNLTPELVGITGRIDIPEADIRLKAIPESSIDESTDTFVIGESKAGEAVTAVKIRPNVLVSLGSKVKMDAFGLVARLSGDVNITHNRRDILANGSLRVQDGKFEAYGQDLAIDNGRLIFNGSPRLIGMDIRATRTIDKQVVGIHLGGSLLNPKSTLYAEPTLEEESEILSYLITGNTLSSASGQESALLLSAVRGLGITGSGSIVQKIGSAFGLDDVNIVTKEDLKESELALGKRLGSRLYVKYLIGLFDQTQKIAIEYKINKALSLEAQTTADDFGLDFIYEIERD